MDDLRELLSVIDDISKTIPEGSYLKICDHAMKIHSSLKCSDPPIVDTRSIPFQAHVHRYNQNERRINDIEDRLDVISRQLRDMKTRKNVTEAVKRYAVREEATRLDVQLHSLTWDALVNKVGRYTVTEREFYKSYIRRFNLRTEQVRYALEEESRRLESELDTLV
jgi:hypothetical protein